MNVNQRLEKIEEKLDMKELPQWLITYSDEDEKEKTKKFCDENPGKPYNIIRIELVKPSFKQES